LPRFAKEALPFEVLVELIRQLYPQVPQDVADYRLHIASRFCHLPRSL
jgi:hypothetical protein